jgi:hypothetical protein
MSDFADGWDAALKSKVVTEMAAALESARGWVSTHAMQTYSRVASKEVEHIDEILTAYRAAIGKGDRKRRTNMTHTPTDQPAKPRDAQFSWTLTKLMNHWTAEIPEAGPVDMGTIDLPFNVEEFCCEMDAERDRLAKALADIKQIHVCEFEERGKGPCDVCEAIAKAKDNSDPGFQVTKENLENGFFK